MYIYIKKYLKSQYIIGLFKKKKHKEINYHENTVKNTYYILCPYYISAITPVVVLNCSEKW